VVARDAQVTELPIADGGEGTWRRWLLLPVDRWEDHPGQVTGPLGSPPAATGRKMRFTGTTVLKVVNGKIVDEVGQIRAGQAHSRHRQVELYVVCLLHAACRLDRLIGG
jgi:hypothetical protein